MAIASIDLMRISNGVYKGNFTTPYNGYIAEVTIHNHAIQGIEIYLKDNFLTYYDQEAQAIVNRILKEQRTNVDVISGATVSSKAILKAIENAVSLTLNYHRHAQTQ